MVSTWFGSNAEWFQHRSVLIGIGGNTPLSIASAYGLGKAQAEPRVICQIASDVMASLAGREVFRVECSSPLHTLDLARRFVERFIAIRQAFFE